MAAPVSPLDSHLSFVARINANPEQPVSRYGTDPDPSAEYATETARATEIHISVIHRHAKSMIDASEVASQHVIMENVVLVARAILDATPPLLEWWCERLRV